MSTVIEPDICPECGRSWMWEYEQLRGEAPNPNCGPCTSAFKEAVIEVLRHTERRTA
jgi:hypothetical protein